MSYTRYKQYFSVNLKEMKKSRTLTYQFNCATADAIKKFTSGMLSHKHMLTVWFKSGHSCGTNRCKIFEMTRKVTSLTLQY